MFPPEATGYPGFKIDILGRVPLVDQGIGDEGLIEPKAEVTECGHLVDGVGIVETNGAAVTGCNNGEGCKQHYGG
jgi:hypothetical protein